MESEGSYEYESSFKKDINISEISSIYDLREFDKSDIESKMDELLDIDLEDKLDLSSFFTEWVFLLFAYYWKTYLKNDIKNLNYNSSQSWWEIVSIIDKYKDSKIFSTSFSDKLLDVWITKEDINEDKKYFKRGPKLLIFTKLNSLESPERDEEYKFILSLLSKDYSHFTYSYYLRIKSFDFLDSETDSQAKKSDLNYSKLDIVSLVKSSIPLEKLTDYLEYGQSLKNESWKKLSSKDMVDLYNAWINKDLLTKSSKLFWYNLDIVDRMEILMIKSFPSLIDYLEAKQVTLKVWVKEISLWINPKSIHFIRALLYMAWDSLDTNWDSIVLDYENYLNEFIEQDDSFDHIFVLWARWKYEDSSWAFKSVSKFVSTMKSNYSDSIISDYSTGTSLWEEIKSPDDYIKKIEDYAVENKWKKMLVYLWLHGFENGNSLFSKWFFTKEHIAKLISLANKYDMILEIDSCYSAKKIDKWKSISGNIRLSSNNSETQSSTMYDFLSAFKKYYYLEKAYVKSVYNKEPKIAKYLNSLWLISKSRHDIYVSQDKTDILSSIKKDSNKIKSLGLEENKIIYFVEDIYNNIKQDINNAADYNWDWRVSYNEASLYKMQKNTLHFSPVYFSSNAWGKQETKMA